MMMNRLTALLALLMLLAQEASSFTTTTHTSARRWTASPSSSSRTQNKLLPYNNPTSASTASNHRHRHHPSSTGGGVGPLHALGLGASPAGALAILAGIVLIHESGHYLAARGFGMKVEEFSVGVGPRLLGFKLFNNEFNLRALPLGGYVRFPENFNVTEANRIESQAMERVDALVEEKLAERGPAAKVLNVLTLGAIGEQEVQKENIRRLQAQGQVPWWRKKFGLAKKQDDADLELIVTPDDIEIDYYDDPQLLQNRPWLERAVVLSGGVVFNFLLAFTIYFGIIFAGSGLPTPVFAPGALVSATPAPTAAASGLLYKGDVVTAINGNPVTATSSLGITSSQPQPTASQAKKGIDNFIQQIRATPAGDSIDLTVLRASTDKKQQPPTAQEPVHVKVVPQTNAATGSQSIGVLLQPNYSQQKLLQASSIPEAAGMAAQYSTEMISDTASGLATALGGLVFGNSNSGAQLSGPIGLIKTGSQVVATEDVRSVLLFAAALSINLGVVNAFPIPALDGGQLVFVLAEAVTGRKVNQRVQESITGATLFFLLLVSAGAAVGDVQSLFGGR